MSQTSRNDCQLSYTLLKKAAGLRGARVAPLEHEGQHYWVKFREDITRLRHKILKGNPQQSLQREISLLRDFAARGAPVPELVAASQDCIILRDHGPDLTQVLPAAAQPDQVLFQVGAALAEMHNLRVAHGRPCIRDICWDGQSATFLDLEAGARVDASPNRLARDLLVLVHSLYTGDPAFHRYANDIVEGYRSKDRSGIVRYAKALAKRLVWMQWLAAPVVWRHRQRGKTSSEFYAVGQTRDLFRKLSA